MANYTIEEGVNFLSNFAKAEQMNYLGESCILVAHDAFEKSKLDIEETFLNGKRKKVLTYDNNPNIILVTPLLEAPFGCSSFDGSKFSMPLSIPTSKNKYTHPDIDLNKVASFKKLLAYLDKQVRTSQEWNQMSNYLPVIRPSADSTKYPDRLRVKIVTDNNSTGLKSVFCNIATGDDMAVDEVPKHAACVCALRVTPVWRMPDGRYGFTLELVRSDIHVRAESVVDSPTTVVEPTP